MNRTLSIFTNLSRWPLGHLLFSKIVCATAPYFGSIKPVIIKLEPNLCECLIKKRKRVFNHIKTVHVIAICNGLEMAMGVMAEASIPENLRWIPKGMTVNYTAKAGTDITCIATINPDDWKTGDAFVEIKAYDTQRTVVVEGQIKLWITEKPKC